MASKNVIKFAPRIKEIRLHLCQTGAESQGARDFVSKFYVPLKKVNPTLPFLIRECSGVQPRLWARYEQGKESSISIKGLEAENVYKELEKLAK
ncbi:NADH dehydrogenase [ubiquinone] 1 alpha subcomplex subunit 2 [Nilaparvata lugens]|uniref:NADH dehydrogenase [ubiquinone] 1 alpha subcomplex subunit 2 n=1 Tax=Nilaparvata lugens TaxID=108931 RepID=UPI000B98974D|nr:NADH dehydrogenase [ubiquinone] 1 alpha subcomplex subunit 2 [Nilaparvata lugens]